jgi:hypothetical protein
VNYHFADQALTGLFSFPASKWSRSLGLLHNVKAPRAFCNLPAFSKLQNTQTSGCFSFFAYDLEREKRSVNTFQAEKCRGFLF